MALANRYGSILVTTDARGRKFGGIISGTPKPGTVMQIKSSTEPVNGKYTWEAYAPGADGDNPKGPLVVLLEDYLQGKLITDAYVSGTLGNLYCPLAGDMLLMLLADVAGTTTDSHAIGELLMVDHGTGKLLVTTGVESEPFVVMETLTGLSADQLCLCMYGAG